MLWSYPRSITGHGTRKTLEFLKQINSELTIHSFPTGMQVFDWEIPEEWNIHGGYLKHESGRIFADFNETPLHVLGYSAPYHNVLSREELIPHIFTQPDQPDVIPYVTSYYRNRWGFCLSENLKQALPDGNYEVCIDAEKKAGQLLLADMLIPGQRAEEIFFSTYICHPAMANNELSGIALATALALYVKEKHPTPHYSYRFVFSPETIGAIAYLSENLRILQQNMACGFVLSCVGDERAYSHIQSRFGDSLADKALEAALLGQENVTTYSFLERGSDERQYCSPGVDLPVCGFCRSKYGEYPEYHTSADNFDVVSARGLEGSYEVVCSIVDAFEIGLYPRAAVLCEPQLGKRNLYPTLSQKGAYGDTKTRLNVFAYSDGRHSLFDIAKIIGKPLRTVLGEVRTLIKHGLLSAHHVPCQRGALRIGGSGGSSENLI
ncbi:MAG: hypothetical protein PWQ57_547 [Desulfovibrionales bacterium]|nr:hypothetical protein [Desulfovibrionales bacterium]